MLLLHLSFLAGKDIVAGPGGDPDVTGEVVQRARDRHDDLNRLSGLLGRPPASGDRAVWSFLCTAHGTRQVPACKPEMTS